MIRMFDEGRSSCDVKFQMTMKDSETTLDMAITASSTGLTAIKDSTRTVCCLTRELAGRSDTRPVRSKLNQIQKQYTPCFGEFNHWRTKARSRHRDRSNASKKPNKTRKKQLNNQGTVDQPTKLTAVTQGTPDEDIAVVDSSDTSDRTEVSDINQGTVDQPTRLTAVTQDTPDEDIAVVDSSDTSDRTEVSDINQGAVDQSAKLTAVAKSTPDEDIAVADGGDTSDRTEVPDTAMTRFTDHIPRTITLVSQTSKQANQLCHGS